MAKKRITELATETTLKDGQYVAIDHTTDGTKKLNLGAELTDLKEDLTLKADLPTETIENVSIASFTDGAEDCPVKELKVGIEPIQDLHGYDNPWPAGGGKNLLDPSKRTVYGSGQGQRWYEADGFVLQANQAYTFSVLYANPIALYIIDKASGDTLASGNNNVSYTPTADVTVYFQGYRGEDISSVGTFQLEKGSTATSYAPYSNICPISGRSSVTVTRTGVNVWDEEVESGYINNSGQPVAEGSSVRSKNFSPCRPNVSFYFRKPSSYQVTPNIVWYDADKGFIRRTDPDTEFPVATSPSNARYFKITMYAYGTTYNHDISINYPSTDHDYHAYEGDSYPIPLSSTIYGGTLDVGTGVLTVDRALVDLGSLEWTRYNFSGVYVFYVNLPTKVSGGSAQGICERYNVVPWTSPGSLLDGQMDIRSNTTYIYVRDDSCSDVASFKSVNDGTKFVYTLATPTTVQLTPTQVTTLLKDNNIFCDSGDVKKLIYRADLGLYIQKLINA